MKIKKILCAVVLISILVLPISVFASESSKTTTLTTTVPDTHPVNLVITGNGIVKIEKQEYKNSQVVQVARLSNQIYHLIPENGWQLDKVMYGTKDAMETVDVKDDKFTAPVLNHDGNTLKIIFVQKTSTEMQKPSDKKTGVQTRDTTHLLLWGVLMAVSAITVYRLNQKENR